MTIHSGKVVFWANLQLISKKNLFEAENLNIDSRGFQESQIYDKTIFSVFVHCILKLYNVQET